jgi:hypothetical protein
MNETPLPTTPNAFVAFVMGRQAYWQARIDRADPGSTTRRRLVNLTSDLLDLLDCLDVQALSTPEDRAFLRASEENHYAQNLPLQGALEATFARAWDAQARGELLPEVPSTSRPLRTYTREEVQSKVAEYLVLMVRYWDELPSPDPLGGMAFSLLTLLDGGPVSLPAFSVHAPGGPDLAGTLHERYSESVRCTDGQDRGARP